MASKDRSLSRRRFSGTRRATVFGRAIRALAGNTSGATFLEYILVCGICALGMVVTFQRFRAKSNIAVRNESKVLASLGTPNPSQVIANLGGFDEYKEMPKCDPKLGICTWPGQCFGAGTLVATESGDRAIESIVPGDLVWARDERTGAVELRPVVRTYITPSSPVIDLELRSGFFRSETVRVTPGHHFWVEGAGWIRAESLAGGSLWSPEAGALTATALGFSEEETVYNLEVDEFHTYFVGRYHAWVHNQDQANKDKGCGGGDEPPEMTCGQLGSYGELKKSSSGGKFHRDHVPSKAALFQRAEDLLDRPLTGNERTAIEKAGMAIVVPAAAHQQLSETYGGRNTPEQIQSDANNLAGAAQRDLDTMLGGIDDYDDSGGCSAAYAQSANEVRSWSNADYDEFLVQTVLNANK